MTDERKAMIASLINIEGVGKDELAELISVPPTRDNGDYTLPCFRFAKALRKSPAAIASELAASIKLQAGDVIRVEAVNGYLNFFTDRKLGAIRTIEKICAEKFSYGDSDEGKGKTVCIDYSSVNIAKPFHIGHLYTTVLGGSLYKIYSKLGYKSVGINHLGDWGTQFGKLIVAFKKWCNKEELDRRGMEVLTEIYVRYHTEAEMHPEMDDEARAYFKKIEDGDEEATELFNLFKEITLREVRKIYERLHITFDSYNGESFYNDKMQPVLDELEEKGLLVESDGAKVVELEKYGMPPCLLVKKDGATLYATRDLAAAYYRKQVYDFYKCLYVVAYQQNLHFRQVFKVLELLGKDWAKDMVHVAFGMVSLEDGAMSTRKGKVILLKDVLDRAVEKAYDIISNKNPDLENKRVTAEKVGVGAVVFSTLYNNRIKDIVFSYDKVLNFDGETAPYVQYTNARCLSLMEKVGGYDAAKADFSGIDNPESEAVAARLGGFGEVLRECIRKYEPCYLARYLVDLCKDFNRFYLVHRIAGEKEGIKNARTMLTAAVHCVIEEGLRLLGIDAPPKM